MSATAVVAGAAFATQVVGVIQSISSDLSTTSLAEFVKPATIDSRVFIEDSLVNEDVTKNIVRSMHSLYVSWICTAMELTQNVTKTKTVGDMLRTVSTENLEDPSDPFVESVSISLENLGKPNKKVNYIPPTKKNIALEDKQSFDSLPAGRVVAITLTNPDVPGKTITINVNVQLSPYAVPPEVVNLFVSMNITPSLKQRYLQWKSGEINFWSDLILQSDLSRERRKLIKSDKGGQLVTILEEQSAAIRKYGANAFGGKEKRRNIANCIMIFEKSTFDNACREANLNFNNNADRDRFFRMSFAMIIAVVDTMYSKVDLYINGIDKTKEYTFKDFEKLSGGSGNDIVQFMQAMQQGNMPRF